MTQPSIEAFLTAHGQRPAWPGIAPDLRPASIPDAYRLLHAVHDRISASGNKCLGWKVGSTSAAGQRIWGLTEPVYAGLFAADQSPNLADALQRPLARPSVEIEIATIIGRTIDASATPATVADSIAACHVACEVIDNRYGDPLSFGVPTLVADDFFQAGWVLGPANPDWRTQDIAAAEGFIDIDGDRKSGSARSILSAFESLCWLARALARDGMALREGDVVLTGTLVPPVPVPAGARTVSMGISGFGTLTS
jgi:2-keto-4-pentenoate hydratase